MPLVPPTEVAAGCASPDHVSHLSDDDNSGAIMERDYTGMFEGPEKTLEVVFRRIHDEHFDSTIGEISGIVPPVDSKAPIQKVGLRQLARADLDKICDRARCTILSCISNRYLDAYVLSESSLFVYPYMLILKTCGTTTLLRCISTIIDLARKFGLEIDWVGYSRKNFNFPGEQQFPHTSFSQELDYLFTHRNLSERLDGNGYTLGPVNGDHWFVFVADCTIRGKALEIDTDRVLNIMMFDISESVAKLFTYGEYLPIDGETKEEEVARISKEQTAKAGIDALCPGAIIDPRAFEPCGYSMNAVLFRSYTTIHITPESGSSYASFETNQKVGSYKSLVSNVIRTFRPKRFVMTLMADEGGIKQVKENPLTDSGANSKIVVPATRLPVAKKPPDSTAVMGSPAPAIGRSSNGCGSGSGSPDDVGRPTGSSIDASSGANKSIIYKRSSLASIKVEEDCCCMMGCWTLEKPGLPQVNGNEGGAGSFRTHKRRGMSFS